MVILYFSLLIINCQLLIVNYSKFIEVKFLFTKTNSYGIIDFKIEGSN